MRDISILQEFILFNKSLDKVLIPSTVVWGSNEKKRSELKCEKTEIKGRNQNKNKMFSVCSSWEQKW